MLEKQHLSENENQDVIKLLTSYHQLVDNFRQYQTCRWSRQPCYTNHHQSLHIYQTDHKENPLWLRKSNPQQIACFLIFFQIFLLLSPLYKVLVLLFPQHLCRPRHQLVCDQN